MLSWPITPDDCGVVSHEAALAPWFLYRFGGLRDTVIRWFTLLTCFALLVPVWVSLGKVGQRVGPWAVGVGSGVLPPPQALPSLGPLSGIPSTSPHPSFSAGTSFESPSRRFLPPSAPRLQRPWKQAGWKGRHTGRGSPILLSPGGWTAFLLNHSLLPPDWECAGTGGAELESALNEWLDLRDQNDAEATLWPALITASTSYTKPCCFPGLPSGNLSCQVLFQAGLYLRSHGYLTGFVVSDNSGGG